MFLAAGRRLTASRPRYEPRTRRYSGAGAPGFFNFGAPTISQFTFDPELPSYELGNLRLGVRSGSWEAAAFVNNLWDERAFLSLDRERGTRARVGYLTNMPRTYGLALRLNF